MRAVMAALGGNPVMSILLRGTKGQEPLVFPLSQEGGGAAASLSSEDRHPAGMKPPRGFGLSTAEIEPCREAAPGSLSNYDKKIRAFGRSRP